LSTFKAQITLYPNDIQTHWIASVNIYSLNRYTDTALIISPNYQSN